MPTNSSPRKFKCTTKVSCTANAREGAEACSTTREEAYSTQLDRLYRTTVAKRFSPPQNKEDEEVLVDEISEYCHDNFSREVSLQFIERFYDKAPDHFVRSRYDFVRAVLTGWDECEKGYVETLSPSEQEIYSSLLTRGKRRFCPAKIRRLKDAFRIARVLAKCARHGENYFQLSCEKLKLRIGLSEDNEAGSLLEHLLKIRAIALSKKGGRRQANRKGKTPASEYIWIADCRTDDNEIKCRTEKAPGAFPSLDTALDNHSSSVDLKYRQALESLPPTGGGCHAALLSVANLGVIAGLTDQAIFSDLRDRVDERSRRAPDSEIQNAIATARRDTNELQDCAAALLPSKKPFIDESRLRHLLSSADGFGEADLWEHSPIRLYDVSGNDHRLFLETLYVPEDQLFIGERYDTTVKSVSDWLAQLERQGAAGLPHVIFNPFTGQMHPGKNGQPSARCDAAVKEYKYAVAEFDETPDCLLSPEQIEEKLRWKQSKHTLPKPGFVDMPRVQQIAFWSAVCLPIVALIDSAGKSIHAIILLEKVRSPEEWILNVKTGLYEKNLIPLGVDPACSNPSRLSRFPGHYRADKNSWQKLLYLNPCPDSTPIINRRTV